MLSGPRLDSRIFASAKISSNSKRRRAAILSTSLVIVITQLRDQDLIAGPPVDNPVLGGDTPRPISLKNVLQRLGFADTRVGIARDFFDQQIDSQNDLLIGALPMEVILPGLRRKDQVHALRFQFALDALAAIQCLNRRNQSLRVSRRAQQVGRFLERFVLGQ